MAKSDQPSNHLPVFSVVRMAVLVLIALMLLLAAFLVGPSFLKRFRPGGSLANAVIEDQSTSTSSPTPTVTLTPTPENVEPELETVIPTALPAAVSGADPQSVIFLSISEAGYAHLFAFFPESFDLKRLTMGDWDDIAPAVSPDGNWLAFASNRGGQFDLFRMSLETGKVEQLTNTPEYESNPSWSPDGLWLAYEAYIADEEGGNLEILIRPVDGSQPAIRLTDDPAADFAPTWSPGGRQIVYVSTRTGDMDIWLSDLDRSDNRDQNLSNEPYSNERHPAWSPDGTKIIWSAYSQDGIERLNLWDAQQPDLKAHPIAIGSWPAWSADGQKISAAFNTPNQTYLTGYRMSDHAALFPLLSMSGEIFGISWGKNPISQSLIQEFTPVALLTMPPLWLPQTQEELIDSQGRAAMVELDGVRAPLPMLQDRADEAFIALRERLADRIGWDFLSILENAYVPLTSPLEPGYIDDWLYTGRAIQINSAPLQAGWMVIAKEDYGPETYWRVYVKARRQDGTQGVPLRVMPFDPFARHSGDPLAYENGGMQSREVPPGYWIDFTQLAAEYGWERLPSLSTWKTSFSGLRFNEFYLPQGLDWFVAMLEVYPRVALNTSTPVLSPTPSATPTNTPTLTPTNTRTPYMSPTPTVTNTRRPTSPATAAPTKKPRD
ncbi:MAG: hypothetical protein B6D39_09970 [Anaerolineae bacterium UTCFX2]|jgi:TolB protein|nr:MAG: hypothetical protein B6D39_09970 [Anaerolineae bacterium UTCFX2]